jgi:Ca2+-transporting ATPase
MPVHVIFMELIIDPASSIAFEMEREDADIMRRAPRDPRRRLFSASLVGRSLLQGVGACLAATTVLALTVRAGLPESDIRTLTFATLIMTNLALIATNRSLSQPVWATVRSGNPAFGWIAVGALTLLAAIVYVPTLRELFRFGDLHLDDIVVITTASVSALVWMELMKRAWRRGDDPRDSGGYPRGRPLSGTL